MKPVAIQVTHDFICPWCWIGHRNLKSALSADESGRPVEISYVPFELNPSLPEAGVNRKEYRTQKFGSWHRSVAMDADVTASGKKVGLNFDYERVQITPNTFLAHRLMAFAQGKGDTSKAEELLNAIFAAYFSRGENIGKVDVLVAVATTVGFDAQQVRDFLLSDEGSAEVLAKELEAQTEGIRGVPLLRIGEARVHGAQPASLLLRILNAEATRLDLSNEPDRPVTECAGGACAIGA
jgi:predicted DsbA family dithiol-disulfide isomerase